MFAIRLKELREKAGYSQAVLARKLGVRQSTVGMWENGTNKPKNSKLEMMATIFDVSTDYLLGRDVDHKPSSGSIRIPVLGTIPAGIPLEAIEDIIDCEEIPESMAKGDQQFFALQVQGHSMQPEYRDGDVVIVRRQDTCENGQDVIAMVNTDDATFKRFKLTPQGIMLQAINPDYDSYMFTRQQVANLPVRILGVVVELRRKLA